MASAPVQPSDVIQMLYGAVWMPLQCGSTYKDGDTVDAEDGMRYQIGRRHETDGMPVDFFVLIHPVSPINEEAEFGPRPGI